MTSTLRRENDLQSKKSPVRSSMFSRMQHPCVLSLPQDRDAILANTRDPLWQQFIEGVKNFFDRGGSIPAPQFPVFCHNGDLDAIMSASVLAYATGDRRCYQSLAMWLRSMISYFHDHVSDWETHLNMLTAGRPTSEIDSRQQGNPRQFFEGFGLPGLYWVEGGLSVCILHLYDLLEAYAPDLLTEEEKLALENALAHFATRFAFHEEAFKYNNRAGYANIAMLIAALTHQDVHAAKLLLNRARERNREIRATFSDDGSYLEGSHAYHYLAADAMVLFALLHNHAFPDQDLMQASAGDDTHDPYPSIETIMLAHARVAIPGEPPREHPRGVGAHLSHLPLSVRSSMIMGYRQNQNPEIGWLLSSSRGTLSKSVPSLMGVTNHTILALGTYVPLETFWLERLPYRTQLPSPGLTILPDFGGFYSRSGGVDAENSFAWAHYGFHGTGKGQRDCAHIGLSIGGNEMLADPFPREGPACRDASFCHNTITANRAETPITIGKLLSSQSLTGMDACLISNVGGAPPQRDYLFDPREESNYVFSIEPTDHPPYTLRRAVVHVHRQMLVVIDDVTLADDAGGPMDWFFYTSGMPQGYDATTASREEEYQYRSPIKQAPVKTYALAVRGERQLIQKETPFARAFAPTPMPLHLTAIALNTNLICEQGHLDHPTYQSVDGTQVAERKAWFTRFRTESRQAQTVWIWSWSEKLPAISVANPFGESGLELKLDTRNIHIRCHGDRIDVNI